MKRLWIVGLRLDAEWQEKSPFPETFTSGFRQTMSALATRVEGDLVFATVPTPALARFLEAAGFAEGLHLVVPDESATRSTAPDGALGTIFASAASVNVPPGRGCGAEDWADCELWLASVAEIDFEIRATGGTGGPDDGAQKPRVVFPIDTGEADFIGFPKDKKLRDPDFEAMVADVFGKRGLPDELDEVKYHANRVASRCAPWFRFLETGSLFLNLCPGLILAVAAAMVWEATTTAIWKFTAALLATVAALGLSRVRSRRRWLSGRAIAEIYRSIQHSGEILDPLLPPSAAHLPRQASVARTLAIAHRRANGPRSIDTVGIRESYLAQRLEGGEGQIAYYGGQARRAQKRRRRVKAIFRLATTLALLSTVVALVSLLGGLPGTEAFNDRWVAGFASFAFPALAAAAVGYLGLSETTRRADYYAEMARALERQRDLLAALRSESAIKETIRETENLLLEEFAGWLRRQVY